MSKTEEGIALILKAAVVLRHGDKPFQATVEVRAITDMGFSLEALPWSNPTPLLFKKDVSFGTALRTPNFARHSQFIVLPPPRIDLFRCDALK